MKRFTLLFVAIAALGLLAVSPAAAQFTAWSELPADFEPPVFQPVPPIPPPPPTEQATFFTDQALFEAAAPGLPLEDFEEGNVPPAGVTLCSDPYDSTTSDACWAPGDIEVGLGIGSSSGTGTVILGAGLIGNTSIVTGPNSFADFTNVLFTGPDTDAVGMDLVIGTPETVDIRIYGTGGLIDTTTGNASPTGTFWGVITDEPIVRIEIESPTGAGQVHDNIQFGAALVPSVLEVPTLSTLGAALLVVLLVVIALVAIVRRR